MHGGGKQRFHTRAVFFLLVSMMVFTPLGPLAEVMISEAEAAAGTRHVYEFSDGSVEHIALYQGANPDMGAAVSLPRGALVTDVSMTLSGASATGWSQIVTDDRDHWIRGTEADIDDRSGDLTLAMSNVSRNFLPHAGDAYVDPNSDAWLDNGSYALRQPHTSNATETLYSQQL
ncbi:MAG TPA: hypothetical protein D7I13_03900, partial [Candidatus Poseidoniales archaeon]